jgi:hypothetical protein
MKNTQNYRKISLIVLGILIFTLIIIFVYNVFKNSKRNPESSTTTYFPKILPINPTENIENIIKPTLAQGDCFYSAIYRSLKDKNLLTNFCNCVNKGNNENNNSIDCNNEGSFIQSFRNFLADNENFKESYMGLFSQLSNMKEEDKNFNDDFPLIIKELNEQIKKILNDYNNENKFVNSNTTKFIKDIMNIIKTRGTYVGEFEVSFTGNILQQCEIPLNIISKKKNDTDYKTDEEILKEIKEQNSDKNVTVILDNDHYEYIV